MNKETINLIIRHVLTAAGSFLIGRSFFGINIDAPTWEGIVGFALTAIGVIWSIKEKNTSIETFQGLVRHALTVFGGILVGAHKLENAQLEDIIGAVMAIFAAIQSFTSRKKVAAIKTDQLSVGKLKGQP